MAALAAAEARLDAVEAAVLGAGPAVVEPADIAAAEEVSGEVADDAEAIADDPDAIADDGDAIADDADATPDDAVAIAVAGVDEAGIAGSDPAGGADAPETAEGVSAEPATVAEPLSAPVEALGQMPDLPLAPEPAPPIPDFAESQVIAAQPLDPQVAEAWQSPAGLVVPATPEAYRAARAAMAAHLIGPKYASEDAEAFAEQELAFAAAAAAEYAPQPLTPPPPPRTRRRRRAFLVLAGLLVVGAVTIAALPIALGNVQLPSDLVAETSGPGASGAASGTATNVPGQSSIASRSNARPSSGGGALATVKPTPGGPSATRSAAPTPRVTPIPTRTPAPTPTRTPVPTPTPKPTPTPSPTPTPMFVTWVSPTSATTVAHFTDLSLSVRTLPSSVCTFTRTGGGRLAASAPSVTAGANGIATVTNWVSTWRKGTGYRVTATCRAPDGRSATTSSAAMITVS